MIDRYKSNLIQLLELIRSIRTNFKAGWRIMIEFVIKKIKIVNLLWLEETQENHDTLATFAGNLEMLSQLLMAVLIVPSAYALNIQPGRRPTQTASTLSYICSFFVIIIGTGLFITIYTPQFERARPYFVGAAGSFIIPIANIVGCTLVIYGAICLSYLYYQRKYLHNFVLYTCSTITNSRLVQREKTTSLFIVAWYISFSDEPLNTILVVYEDFVQPKFSPNLSSLQFATLKITCCFFIALLGTSLSIVMLVIPMITVLLSQSMENHLEIEFDKQAQRLIEAKPSNLVRPNPHLSSLLVDANSEAILAEYQLETFCLDWPQAGVPGSSHVDMKSTNAVNGKNELVDPDQTQQVNFQMVRSQRHTIEVSNFGMVNQISQCQQGALS